MSNSFFSVVMPTYNRAKLLPLAIESVLRQTFEDFEIVISNGGSTDNTAEVVAGFDDPRIRYVESKERLSIGDNYQNALDNASGQYIAFLSDDDAFVPLMLERVKNVIDEHRAEVVAFQVSNYYHDGDVAFNRQIAPNTLAVQPFTGKVTRFETKQAIKLLYQLKGLRRGEQNDDFIVSYLANAVYHRSVFSRIKEVRNKLFDSTPADLYLAAAVFFVTDWYYCLSEPLHIWSNWAENATASPHKKADELRKHYEKLLNGKSLEHTPLKFALPHNCCANAVLQAQDDFDKSSDKIKVDWVGYYVGVYDDLMFLKNIGVDVAREIHEFDETIVCQSKELQQQVKAEIRNLRFVAKQLARKFPAAIRLVKHISKQKDSDKPDLISGEQNGFCNALEAADFIATGILKKQRRW